MRIFAAAALICLAAFSAGAMKKVPVADAVIVADGFPKTLAEFGFFKDAAGWIPNDRVQPYELNMPLFTDYAKKYRYIYIPPGKQAKANGDGLLEFPVGSALIKSFGYTIDGPDGKKPRLLETRVMLHRADGWLALPYVWNTEQTEAILKVAGKRIPVSFTDPSGNKQTISYAVPNKNQCKDCHSLSRAVMPIGPKARNLDDGVQLEKFAALGLIDKRPKVENAAKVENAVPIWGKPDSGTLNSRARSYLDVNCAHCHNRQGSASNSGLFLTYEEDEMVHVGVKKRPTAAGRGSGGHEFAIAPGKPDESITIYRMKSLDPGIAMPEIGKSMVHTEGVDLLSEWIKGMGK